MVAGSERVMRETRMFSRQVDAATVDPAFVASVRRRRALDRREAAEICGGGDNALSLIAVVLRRAGDVAAR